MRVRGGPATVTGERTPPRHGRVRGGKAGESGDPGARRLPPFVISRLAGVDTRGRDLAHAYAPERRMIPPYPFSAVVGMDDLKLALLLNAVSPGGRRRAGPRREGHGEVDGGPGAGRRCCPPVDVVAGCRFSCDPAAPGPGLPGRPARRRRTGRTPAGPAGRTAGRRHRGPGRRLAGPGAGARRRRQGVRARPAGRRAPRRALRRRGQPAARPPGRPAARRRRDGPVVRRARGRLGRSTPPGSCWSAR